MSSADHDHDGLVSVVIPTFNRPEYLRLALASAVAQSYANLEIIVCDNASPQDPSELVAAFGDPRIRLHRNVANLGQTPNILNGVAMATGKHVAILGDDDVWHPEFIATLLAPMAADPDIVVSFCDHAIIDAAGKVNGVATDMVRRRFGRHLLRDGVYRAFDEIALVYRSICIVSGSLIRKDAIDWSRIPRDMPISVDLYIAYLLAISGGSCAYTSAELMQFRYHSLERPTAFTNVQSSWQANLRCTFNLWMTFLRDDRLKIRPYTRMICARKAAMMLLDRVQRRDWRGAAADLVQLARQGVLRPSAIYYHLVYLLRFHRLGMGRLLP